jgi:hypothetical protein
MLNPMLPYHAAWKKKKKEEIEAILRFLSITNFLDLFVSTVMANNDRDQAS